MSTSNQQDTHDPNSLLYYAPRRLRDRANALRALQPWPGESKTVGPEAPPDQPPSEAALPPEKPFPETLRPSAEPEPLEPGDLVPPRARRKEVFAVAARFAAVAAIIVGVAVPSVMYFAASRGQTPSKDSATSLFATTQAKTAAVARLIKKMSAPALVVEDGDGNINGPLPLGVKIFGHPQGETVNLSGLLADTKLTTGAASVAGQWRVAINDLPVTAVIPPRDYVGQMNIVAEMPADDGQSVLRKVVHLAWRQPPPRPGNATPTPAPSAPPAAKAAASEPARQIEPKEIAALIKRGEDLVSIGDLPAARLLLQRAAEAHDARAAFELAATYDPAATKQLGGSATGPDLALARTWYQRARDWGSPDAPKQLEALASAAR